MIPPLGPDIRAWAQQVRIAFERAQAALLWKTASASSATNGTILWDEDGGYPVVSREGAFVRVAFLVDAPANASDTGTAGDVAYDASYFYVCTATDTWARVAIATW